MALSLEDIVQQGLDYAIVDEADSVLIDEARTPLIISGPGQETLAFTTSWPNWLEEWFQVWTLTLKKRNEMSFCMSLEHIR